MEKKFTVHDVTGNKDIAVEIGKFPGGEIRVKLAETGRTVVRVTAYLFNSDDVMTLVMITDALRQMGVEHIRLTIPYIPYARQDRVCNKGEAFSIKAFAAIINSLNFSSVVVYDPHSDVSTACLDRVVVLNQAEIMNKHIALRNWLTEAYLTSSTPAEAQEVLPTYLVCPDAGAAKKIYTVAKTVPYFKGIIFAEKVRDVATGEIVKTRVSELPDDVANARLLVVDDICDGGRTFIELGKVLRPYCKELNLYVTQGFFSKGMEAFEPFFDNVWSTVNFKDFE